MVTDQLLERMLRMTSRLRGATVFTFCYNSWLPQKQGNTFKWVLILLLGWFYKSCCGSCLFHNRAFFFVCLILVASCSRIMFLFHCICFFNVVSRSHCRKTNLHVTSSSVYPICVCITQLIYPGGVIIYLIYIQHIEYSRYCVICSFGRYTSGNKHRHNYTTNTTNQS